MGLEAVTYISDLVITNPVGASDPKNEGDDHIRNIKKSLKNTFPNITGAVTPTQAELNYVAGVTSALQTQLNAKAPLASPVFTGDPQAPTPAPGDNDVSIATTAFVAAAVAAAVGALFTTGDIKPTIKAAADTGWVMLDDGNIGDATSGATTRANADTSALFALLWNNTADADCPVSGGRGGSAAADFAAHKTITLPQVKGRALGAAGTGTGLTVRALAKALGEETHLLTAAESGLPAHIHGMANGGNPISTTPGSGASGGTSLGQTSISANSAADAAQAHNNMQPTVFVNWMVKL